MLLSHLTPAYVTNWGAAYCGDSLRLLAELPDESVNLVLTSPLSNCAELVQGPMVVRALGREGAAKVGAKLATIGTVLQTIVRTRVADLSF